MRMYVRFRTFVFATAKPFFRFELREKKKAFEALALAILIEDGYNHNKSGFKWCFGVKSCVIHSRRARMLAHCAAAHPVFAKGGLIPVLMGEYSHTLDPKGRTNFPVKLREGLGDAFVLTKGLDNCLFVYSKSEWEILSRRTGELPLNKSRGLQRFFFAGAAEVEVDRQGRIIIPQHLREYAGLEKDITIIGASTRAEIWSSARWAQSLSSLTPDAIADAMEELGF